MHRVPAGVLALCIGVILLSACGDGDSSTDPDAAVDGSDASGDSILESCESVAPTECSDEDFPFASIEPIIQERCATCHDGSGEEWPLSTWRHVADWATEVRGVMLDCSMPPADSDVEMTQAERDAIMMWVRCGRDP